MATNLRLSPAAAEALRRAAQATGRSQADLLREAVDRYLGLDSPSSDRARARDNGRVHPGTPYRYVEPSVHLPSGRSTRDLLDRDSDPR